jgi:hypothetical protein
MQDIEKYRRLWRARVVKIAYGYRGVWGGEKLWQTWTKKRRELKETPESKTKNDGGGDDDDDINNKFGRGTRKTFDRFTTKDS